ncbi:serine/threonine-protein kinase tricorner isoform X6 [Vespula squamosa]|uniref:Serine/threonine-protein kinase tricorner isoform X6 n=1 Tax=Vespula squamosa TaxID=30214 RepID=A0ABD2AZP9_VESSQ
MRRGIAFRLHGMYQAKVVECEEATEVETHHQQTAATTMGVAEDDTPSSLTSHPNLNTNNPGQEDYVRINLSIFINAAQFLRSAKKGFFKDLRSPTAGLAKTLNCIQTFSLLEF